MSGRKQRLQALLDRRIAVLDGALGTNVQALDLSEADFRGERFVDWPHELRGNNDVLCITQPEHVVRIHRDFLAAGADIITTNTFNATAPSQGDYGLSALVGELNLAAARLARNTADAVAAETDIPRFVAGALGPTNRTCSISPDVNDPGLRKITFDELADTYATAAAALIEGGVDLLMVETVFDTLNAKAALYAIQRLRDSTGVDIPIMISGTITDASGRTLSGQTLEAFYNSVRHADPLLIGLNCALGATELRPYVEELAGPVGVPRQRVSECRAAERVWRIRRHARAHGRRARRIRCQRLDQPGRRMLRHDGAAHRGHCPGRRQARAAAPAQGRKNHAAVGPGVVQDRSPTACSSTLANAPMSPGRRASDCSSANRTTNRLSTWRASRSRAVRS